MVCRSLFQVACRPQKMERGALVLLVSILLATGSATLIEGQDSRSSPRLRPPALSPRLTCDRTVIKVSEALPCHVYFIIDRRSTGIVLPRVVMPYLVKGRPPTVMTFHVEREGSKLALEPSYSATHGRYHPPAGVQEQELLFLGSGGIFGWTNDLNGDDWVLPKKPGTYQLSATIKIDLAERDSQGKVYDGVAKLAGDFLDQIENAVASGEWTSNPVTIVILPDAQ